MEDKEPTPNTNKFRIKYGKGIPSRQWGLSKIKIENQTSHTLRKWGLCISKGSETKSRHIDDKNRN